MERKTKIRAEDGKQELMITREFDLPLELLFQAYVEPEIVEQWMGTRVLKLENKRGGSWQFETTDSKGDKHRFNGVTHEFAEYRKITRTFEMENTNFPVQLEFLEFGRVSDATSLLSMQIIFRSVTDRDRMLKLPFASGINTAHDRLQEVVGRLK